MVIGILQCDEVDPAWVSEYGQYGEMFVSAFKRLAPELEYRVFDAQAGELPALDECDGYVITGSRNSAYEPLQWIAGLSEWLRAAFEHDKPLFGVCFGHQILAQALGGKVEKAPQGWGMGAYRTHVEQIAPWMTQAQPTLCLLSSHQDQVVSLPPNATRLVSNGFCPNYSFAIDDRVFTVQGHPEFVPEYNRLIAEKRREQIGDVTYYNAMASFNLPLDSEQFLTWALRFLTRAS